MATTIRDVVARTRAGRSAKFEVMVRLGAPSVEPLDLQGRGIVDFGADRVRVAEQIATPRTRGRRDVTASGRLIRRPVFAVADWIVGKDGFYEGGARWTLRKGRWTGPDGELGGPKTTRHPLFLLDLLEADPGELTGGRREDLGGVELSRHDLSLDREVIPPRAWESWLQGQDGAVSRPPQATLWVADDGVLGCFAYETFLADGDGPSWKATRLWDFGTSTAELDRVAEAISRR